MINTVRLSPIDAILALRLLAELHREFRQPLHAAYIDIKAAFDSVDCRLFGRHCMPLELHNF